MPGPQTSRHTETLVEPGLQMPYTEQWNLSFERELPFTSKIRVSYTGTHAVGLIRYASGNLPDNNPNGVLVVNHANNAPSVLYSNLSSFPATDPRRVDVRGQTLHLAADPFCAGTGLPSISNPPPGVTIDANGIIIWTPSPGQVPSIMATTAALDLARKADIHCVRLGRRALRD